jgi:hypothetical protein
VNIITWPDIVTAVAAALSFFVLLAALLVAKREITCIDRTREAELLAELSRRWNEEQLTASRKAALNYKSGAELKKAVQKLRESKDKEYYDLVRLPDFFEALGVLVSSSCLSKQLTKDLFGTAIKHYYDLYGPTIQYLCKIHGDKNVYIWFDKLVNELSRLN